ncbi:hypothetical protein [Pseudoalteromonas sp. SR44-2]|uniref:hypothetical protein n=1 Tax=Pseudoalteromonas sp. SR44-2 TaxID=2760937 RepID=UPI0015FFF3FA|nr:hypothetical protein [Pseudoalteromonas sp. SR44-2]MBB1336211.1 hypothetical protein [Pseudoalteromonas sp. SR44-2]
MLKTIQEKLKEPLNESTRLSRKYLMLSSFVGVLVGNVGLIPDKITAFGISFTSSNQAALITLLCAVVIYFLVNFLTFIYSERITYKFSEISEIIESEKKRSEEGLLSHIFMQDIEVKVDRAVLKVKSVIRIRMLIEVFIPVVFSMYALFSLMLKLATV